MIYESDKILLLNPKKIKNFSNYIGHYLIFALVIENL